MRVGLYKGTSAVSLAIRFITRSDYSHAAFVFDDGACRAAELLRAKGSAFRKLHFYHPGAVVEAWQGGVRNSLSVSTLHKGGTTVDMFEYPGLTAAQEESLVAFCEDIIGWPYGFLNVLRFVTRHPGRDDGSYFCSEAVFEGFRKAGAQLLERVHDWEVPPAWLRMAPALRYHSTVQTR